MNRASTLLQLVEEDRLFYHGTRSKFGQFDPEYAGKGNDQEGPGFYFTTHEQEARGYAYPDGHILVARIHLHKTVPLSGTTTLGMQKQVKQLIRSAPDLEDTLTDWGEHPSAAFDYAYQQTIRYSDSPKDCFEQVWYDFYRHSAANWMAEMVKLGYDGLLIPRNDGTVHAVVYNPECIELLETRFL